MKSFALTLTLLHYNLNWQKARNIYSCIKHSYRETWQNMNSDYLCVIFPLCLNF